MLCDQENGVLRYYSDIFLGEPHHRHQSQIREPIASKRKEEPTGGDVCD